MDDLHTIAAIFPDAKKIEGFLYNDVVAYRLNGAWVIRTIDGCDTVCGSTENLVRALKASE